MDPKVGSLMHELGEAHKKRAAHLTQHAQLKGQGKAATSQLASRPSPGRLPGEEMAVQQEIAAAKKAVRMCVCAYTHTHTHTHTHIHTHTHTHMLVLHTHTHKYNVYIHTYVYIHTRHAIPITARRSSPRRGGSSGGGPSKQTWSEKLRLHAAAPTTTCRTAVYRGTRRLQVCCPVGCARDSCACVFFEGGGCARDTCPCAFLSAGLAGTSLRAHGFLRQRFPALLAKLCFECLHACLLAVEHKNSYGVHACVLACMHAIAVPRAWSR
jgi:hypothetical protein